MTLRLPADSVNPVEPPNPPVDVTVIVCTRNREAKLHDSLASVLASLDAFAGPGGGELVVVDNASSDRTAEVIAQHAESDPRVRYAFAPEPGLARARNVGVRAARGTALLFTDDDIVVPVEWVTRMSAPLLDDEADLVGGGVAMAPELEREWMTTELQKLYFAHNPVPIESGPEPVGASMGARREVAVRFPFDEALGVQPYPGAEDVLFYFQIFEAGYRLHGVLDAPVEHHFDPSRLEPTRLRQLAEGYGRCDAYVSHHWFGVQIPRQSLWLAAHWLRLKWIEARRPDPHSERLIREIRTVSFHREFRSLRRTAPRYGTRESRQSVRVQG